MTYNLTQLQNADTMYKLAVYANDATGQLLFVLMIMSVFFIMLMVLKKWDFIKALVTSSFVCFVISMVLMYAQLIPLVWALIFLTVTAFTAFYMFMSGS